MRSLSKLLIVGAAALGAASVKTAMVGLKAGPAIFSGVTAGRVGRVVAGQAMLKESWGDATSESDPASVPLSPAQLQAFLADAQSAAEAAQPATLSHFDLTPQLSFGESDAMRSMRLAQEVEMRVQQSQMQQLQLQQIQAQQFLLQQQFR